jgi:DNA polymerase III delta subunit
VKFLIHIKGPSDAGPGERQQMLDMAHQALEEAGVEAADEVRIDVPARGASESGEGTMRPEVEPVVPALQSGSLFGGKSGVFVTDAHALRAAEASTVAELLGLADAEAVQVVLASTGALAGPLTAAVKERGEVLTVKKLRERDAAGWVVGEARNRRISLPKEAVEALVERFGSDVAGLGQALDQLAMSEGPITAEGIRDRFRNRPDEPMWLYGDAVADGDVATALRRLRDFLTHSHPLVLLAFMERELKRRALAAAAPDIETFASWVNSKANAFPIQKAWRARGKVSDDDLRRAISAFARADETMKTQPEDTHLVTLERLTVALCYWYGR